MAWPVSAAAAESLASGHIKGTLKVEVWNGNTYLQNIDITGGSVNEDETATPRRTLTLTVADRTLVPNDPTDLLHPLSGNELRPFWGIVILGGVSVASTLVETTTTTPGTGGGGTPGTDTAWDSGGTWDDGDSWDDDSASGGGGGATGPSDPTYDSGTTYDSATTYDNPTPGAPGVGTDDSSGTWDSGSSWDSGGSWDSTGAGVPGGGSTTTMTVDSIVTTTAATTEWVPLGVFRMTQPSTTYTGASTVTTVNGHDRSHEISLRTWTFAYTIKAGFTVDQAIVAILNDRWGNTQPALTYNVTPTSIIVPTGTVLGVDFTSSGAQSAANSSGNDPWADCVSLAQSVGCELFFDRQGIVVMRTVPDASTVPVTSRFVDGQNGTLVDQVVRELDETTMVNQVIMIGTGATVTNQDGSVSPGAPVTATASYMDPVLGINGVFGARTSFVTNSAISDVGTCQIAANSALSLGLASLDDTSFEAVPNPTIEVGDADRLIEPAVQADGTYIVSAITFPLDISNPMQVTNRASSVSFTGTNPGSGSGGGSGTGPGTGPGPTALPDMVISLLSTPTGFTAGDSIQFVATVLNQGTGPTPASQAIATVIFQVDGQQVAISDTYSQVIPAGHSVVLWSDAPWTATAGSHVLTATVNPPPNQYPESDATNNTATVNFTVAAAAPIPAGPGPVTWTTTSLPGGALGVPYSTQLQATNATNYALASGTLPSGLKIAAATGLLSGTPTTATTYLPAITASNSASTATAGPFSLNITTPYSYGPGGTYTTWEFPNPTQVGLYTSLQWVFSPVQDAPASMTGSAAGQPFSGFLHYYAMQFSIVNSTGALGGGYAGFQTNGNWQGTSQGKVINFSIWGSTGGNTTNASTLVLAQNSESGGYQMMLRYNWTVGHNYKFNLAVGPGGVTTAGTWWGITVTDTTTSTATYVGEQLIPNTISGLPSTSLHGSLSPFGEDTHWWQSMNGGTVYSSPSAFPNSAMAMTGNTANGSITPASMVWSTSTGTTNTGTNGYKTTSAKATEYVNTTTMAAQHNLGFWATPPPNTVGGIQVF